MFQVCELVDSKKYRDFLASCPLATLQQSFAWADFQHKVPGRSTAFALAVCDEKEELAVTAIVTKMHLPFKRSYYYIQRGPLVRSDLPEIETAVKLLFQEIAQRAKQDKVVFLRIDPPFSFGASKINALADFYHTLGFHKAHSNFFPEHTLLVNLSKPKSEILAQMKQKGRYNIHLAEKKGVTVYQSTDAHEIEYFWKLLQATTVRTGFHGHGKQFYKDMLETLSKYRFAELLLAEYGGQVIAANLMTYFKDTATYYYGASSNQHRNVMSPYLLQWKAMELAKQKGMKFYDLLGIAPEGVTDHPWAGVTGFKLKFGGTRIQYLPAQEFVYDKKTYLTMLFLKRLRKFFRK
jgi:peptidoglycan pentaglycine glycine transferase (the first glycine)